MQHIRNTNETQAKHGISLPPPLSLQLHLEGLGWRYKRIRIVHIIRLDNRRRPFRIEGIRSVQRFRPGSVSQGGWPLGRRSCCGGCGGGSRCLSHPLSVLIHSPHHRQHPLSWRGNLLRRRCASHSCGQNPVRSQWRDNGNSLPIRWGIGRGNRWKRFLPLEIVIRELLLVVVVVVVTLQDGRSGGRAHRGGREGGRVSLGQL